MADLPEPDAGTPGGSPDAAEPAAPDRPTVRRRTLERRTIAICAVLGIAASLLTLLVASFILGDDDASDQALEVRDPSSSGLMTQDLETAEGTTTDLASFQEGKPMVVNLWQSACVPCRQEMPLLNDARTDNPDVTFVGVAILDELENAQGLADQTDIAYPWVLDPTGELFYEAGGQGMPTTLLLDADGTVIDKKTAEFKTAGELQAFIDQAA